MKIEVDPGDLEGGEHGQHDVVEAGDAAVGPRPFL